MAAFAPRAVLVASVLLGLTDVATALITRSLSANATQALHQSNSLLRAQLNSSKQQPWLFFDFGFFDGTDSLSYLTQGMRVVAVEADPSLVIAGGSNPALAPFIATGMLKILNYAIAPLSAGNTASWTTFYMNKCSKEWNSFNTDVGCRSCVPPHNEDPTKASCVPTPVQSTPCAKVFQDYGIPVYMKADMEGAEAGCYKALEAYPVQSRPNLISGEVTDDKLVDVFAGFGYTSFKVVKQLSGHSGPWGDYAQDCRVGAKWRSYAGAKEELRKLMDKANPAPITDACPSIVAGYGTWYDIHGSRFPPQA